MSYVGKGSLAGQFLSWSTAHGAYRWLPLVAPTAGQVLSWDGSVPVWIAPPSGFTAGGDLSGTATDQTVVGLQSRAVASTAPTNGQVLTWDAGLSQWYPATGGGGGGATPDVYETVAQAEAATGSDNDLCYVVENDTWYRYEATDASKGWRDYRVFLLTGDGVPTRWMAIAGRYGNCANSRMPIEGPTSIASTNRRVFLGRDALSQIGTVNDGDHATAIGFEAGKNLTGGSGNTLIGAHAGRDMQTDSNNVVIGHNAALTMSGSGNVNNTIIGVDACAGVGSTTAAVGCVYIGKGAGYQNPGYYSTYIGFEAGYGAGFTSRGNNNTGIGYQSLYQGPSGGQNTCIGTSTGRNITSGRYNTFLGHESGKDLTGGEYNIGIGVDSLAGILTGEHNVGIGDFALSGSADSNRSYAIGIGSHAGGHGGDHTVYIGYYSGWNTGLASHNIGIGRQALMGGVSVPLTGTHNIAIGDDAAAGVIGTAADNVVIGRGAGLGLTQGTDNILCGTNAGSSLAASTHNVAIGKNSQLNATQATAVPGHNVTIGTDSGQNITSGTHNTCVGKDSGQSIVSGNNNTCLGHLARVDDVAASNRTALGYNTVSLSDNSVRLGEYGTTSVYGGTYNTDSDVRFKTAIEDCDLGLDFICALTPRKYQMKVSGYDEMTPEQQLEAQAKQGVNHGFIAQEVKALLESLGIESNIHDTQESSDGFNPQAVNYTAMVAPLVKAVQELAALVDELQFEVVKLEEDAQ